MSSKNRPSWTQRLLQKLRPIATSEQAITNPPQQANIKYRIGDYTSFAEAMLEKVPTQTIVSADGNLILPLKGLNPHADHDYSIALIKVWAMTGDILTFYQERIANEGYLRTATEEESMVAFTHGVDYRYKPSLSASTYLAFTVNQAVGMMNIPKGTAAQNSGGNAVVFQTYEAIDARPEWNAMKIYIDDSPRPQIVSAQATQLRVSGTNTNLKAGNQILLSGNWYPTTDKVYFWLPLSLVEIKKEDKGTAYTLLAWDTPLQAPQAVLAENPDTYLDNIQIQHFKQSASVFGHSAPLWDSLKPRQQAIYSPYLGGIYQSFTAGSDWQQLTAELPAQQIRDLAVTIDGYILAATDKGVFRSADGINWESANTGIRGKNIYTLAVTANSKYVFAGGADGGVYRSGDNGKAWQILPGNIDVVNTLVLNYRMPSVDIHAIYSYLDNNNVTWIFAGTGSGIFKSNDNGAQWQPYNGGLPGASPRNPYADMIVYDLLIIDGVFSNKSLPNGAKLTETASPDSNKSLSSDASSSTLLPLTTGNCLVAATNYGTFFIELGKPCWRPLLAGFNTVPVSNVASPNGSDITQPSSDDGESPSNIKQELSALVTDTLNQILQEVTNKMTNTPHTQEVTNIYSTLQTNFTQDIDAYLKDDIKPITNYLINYPYQNLFTDPPEVPDNIEAAILNDLEGKLNNFLAKHSLPIINNTSTLPTSSISSDDEGTSGDTEKSDLQKALDALRDVGTAIESDSKDIKTANDEISTKAQDIKNRSRGNFLGIGQGTNNNALDADTILNDSQIINNKNSAIEAQAQTIPNHVSDIINALTNLENDAQTYYYGFAISYAFADYETKVKGNLETILNKISDITFINGLTQLEGLSNKLVGNRVNELAQIMKVTATAIFTQAFQGGLEQLLSILNDADLGTNPPSDYLKQLAAQIQDSASTMVTLLSDATTGLIGLESTIMNISLDTFSDVTSVTQASVQTLVNEMVGELTQEFADLLTKQEQYFIDKAYASLCLDTGGHYLADIIVYSMVYVDSVKYLVVGTNQGIWRINLADGTTQAWEQVQATKNLVIQKIIQTVSTNAISTAPRLFATSNLGLWISNDAGLTWQILSDTLQKIFVYAPSQAQDISQLAHGSIPTSLRQQFRLFGNPLSERVFIDKISTGCDPAQLIVPTNLQDKILPVGVLFIQQREQFLELGTYIHISSVADDSHAPSFMIDLVRYDINALDAGWLTDNILNSFSTHNITLDPRNPVLKAGNPNDWYLVQPDAVYALTKLSDTQLAVYHCSEYTFLGSNAISTNRTIPIREKCEDESLLINSDDVSKLIESIKRQVNLSPLITTLMSQATSTAINLKTSEQIIWIITDGERQYRLLQHGHILTVYTMVQLQFILATSTLNASDYTQLLDNKMPVSLSSLLAQHNYKLTNPRLQNHIESENGKDTLVWSLSDGQNQLRMLDRTRQSGTQKLHYLDVYSFAPNIMAALVDADKGLIVATPVGDILHTEWPAFALPDNTVELDKTYPNILNNTDIVLDNVTLPPATVTTPDFMIVTIQDQIDQRRAGFSLSKNITSLMVNTNPALLDVNLRTAAVYFQPEDFSPATESKNIQQFPQPVGGIKQTTIQLSGAYDTIKAQQSIAIVGKRINAHLRSGIGGVRAITLADSTQPYASIGLMECDILAQTMITFNQKDYLFVGTSAGFFYLDYSSCQAKKGALPNYCDWQTLGLHDYEINGISANINPDQTLSLFAATNQGLWVNINFESSNWRPVPAFQQNAIPHLQRCGQDLYFTTDTREVFSFSLVLPANSAPNSISFNYLGRVPDTKAAINVLYAYQSTDGSHQLYIGTDSGLYHYKANQLQTVATSITAITGLCSDFADGLYVGTTAGIYHLKSNQDHVLLGLTDDVITSILVTQTTGGKNYLVVGTRYNGLFTAETETFNWQVRYIGLSASINTLLHYQDDQIFIGGDASLRVTHHSPRQVQSLRRPYLFTLSDTDAFLATLMQRNITDALRDAFKKANYSLPADAIVHHSDNEPIWLIGDSNTDFVIIYQLGQLQVYRNLSFEVVKIQAGQAESDSTRADIYTIQLAQSLIADFCATSDDIRFIAASDQSTTISEVRQIILSKVSDDGLTTMLYLTDEIENVYDPQTVSICANVARATQGQSITDEALGSGDASKSNQEFSISRPPLTFVLGDDISGAVPEIAVYVRQPNLQPPYLPGEVPTTDTFHGQPWTKVENLYDSGPLDTHYMVRLDNNGRLRIIFGDGIHGARLPKGSNNIRVSYRSGGGKIGNVDVNQITRLQKRSRDLTAVTNPIAAEDGINAEDLSTLKTNLPRSLHNLERIVSLQDYADFVHQMVGIGKVDARHLWSGRRRVVYLTIALDDGKPLDTSSKLAANITSNIIAAQAGEQAFIISTYSKRFFNLSLNVFVEPKLNEQAQQAVKNTIRNILLAAFTEAIREFGQSVTAVEIIHLVQGVQFVIAAEITSFFKVGDQQSPIPPEMLTADTVYWDKQLDRIIPAELLLINGETQAEASTSLAGININLI